MYRAMLADQNDEPLVADDNGLGVRDNSYVPHDVSVGANDIVPPSEGMSVFRDVKFIPPKRRPQDHGGQALAGVYLFVWGDGAFQSAALNQELRMVRGKKKRSKHGQIEPINQITLTVFRQHLVATKPNWAIVKGNYVVP